MSLHWLVDGEIIIECVSTTLFNALRKGKHLNRIITDNVNTGKHSFILSKSTLMLSPCR